MFRSLKLESFVFVSQINRSREGFSDEELEYIKSIDIEMLFIKIDTEPRESILDDIKLYYKTKIVDKILNPNGHALLSSGEGGTPNRKSILPARNVSAFNNIDDGMDAKKEKLKSILSETFKTI